MHLDIATKVLLASVEMFIVEWSSGVEGRNTQNAVTAGALASKVAVHALRQS
jgi:hypothetical protein